MEIEETIAKFYHRYLERLSQWYGNKISIMEDFDLICQCEVDFIEILLLGEQEFGINLLENTQEREDFEKIRDFINWAATKPS